MPICQNRVAFEKPKMLKKIEKPTPFPLDTACEICYILSDNFVEEFFGNRLFF